MGGGFFWRSPCQSGQAFAFAHGLLALNDDGIGIVGNAVNYGVSQRGSTDLRVSATNVKLGAEDGGGFLVAAFRNLRQITKLDVFKGIKQPLAKDKELYLFVSGDGFAINVVNLT